MLDITRLRANGKKIDGVGDEKWLLIGFALFNEGMELSVWEQWSRTQPEFKEGEYESKWNGFHHDPNGISIASLYQWATEGGYVEKEIRNNWYQLHPELKPSAKHNMDETTKRELDDATQKTKSKKTTLTLLKN